MSLCGSLRNTLFSSLGIQGRHLDTKTHPKSNKEQITNLTQETPNTTDRHVVRLLCTEKSNTSYRIQHL